MVLTSLDRWLIETARRQRERPCQGVAMSYLPEDYEPVEDRIGPSQRPPPGRITTDVLSLDGDSVTFRASVYRDIDPDPSPRPQAMPTAYLPNPRLSSSLKQSALAGHWQTWDMQSKAPGPAREEMQAFQDVKQPSYPPRNPARKEASKPATEKQVSLPGCS